MGNASEPEDAQGDDAALLGLLARSAKASSPAGGSSAELEPGTYTVSANVSMPTPIPGIIGYATNPANPEGIGSAQGIPSTPVDNACQLVVEEDGTCTLAVELVNPVFTVQSVGSSDEVTVVDTESVPVEKKEGDSAYNDKVAAAGITERISEMTLRFKSWGGTYVFGDCTEYATTLDTRFENALTLTVDLANAKRVVEEGLERAFADEATGVSLLVKAEADSAVFGDLQVAELSVSKTEQGPDFDYVKKALEKQYRAAPEFVLYSVSLTAGGKEVAFDDKVSATLFFEGEGTDVFALKDGSLNDMEAGGGAGGVSFEPGELGEFVVVSEKDGNARWLGSYTFSDDASGVSVTWVTTGASESDYNVGMDAEAVLDLLTGYTTIVGGASQEGPLCDQALELIEKAEGSDGVEIAGIYAAGLDFMGLPFTSMVSYVGNGECGYSVNVPVEDDASAVYLVEGTTAGLTSVEEVEATLGRGRACIDALPVEGYEKTGDTGAAIESKLLNGANFLNGNEDAMSDESIAYYVVANVEGEPGPGPEAGLEAGTYRVTANAYVGADESPIGANAYFTNPAVPPTSPASDNATLVVGEDGTLTLGLPIENEVFSLQEVSDGADVEVVEAERGGQLSWGSSPVPENPPYADRITKLTLRLANGSGSYTLGDCVEYPTLLGSEQTWGVHVSVDFDSAQKQYVPGEDEFEGEFEDGGVRLSVSTTEAYGASLPGARLVAQAVTSGDSYDSFAAFVAESYSGAADFKVYDLSLEAADGTAIEIGGSNSVEVSFPAGYESAALYSLGEGGPVRLDADVEGGSVTYADDFVEGLGLFAVVDTATASEWALDREWSDEATGVTLAVKSTGQKGAPTEGSAANYRLLASKDTQGANVDAALEAVRGTGDYSEPAVEAVYRASLDSTSWSGGTGALNEKFGNGNAVLRATVPVSGEGDSVYLVQRTAEGTTAARIDADVAGGEASFDLIGMDMEVRSAMDLRNSLWNSASGKWWDMLKAKDQTDETPLAYVAVVREGEPGPGPEAGLEAGTYRVTANFYVPGSENDIISGLTAYMTNPKNPMEEAGSPNYGVPTTPVKDNATLVVKGDGTRLLQIDLPNPAFTLIDFGVAPEGAEVLGAERDGKAYGTNEQGRITSAVLRIDGDGELFLFRDNHVYAAPLKLDKRWDALLEIDYSSATKTSDGTDIEVPDGGAQGGSENQGGQSGQEGDGSGGGSSSGEASASEVGSGLLAAGTYTVSANIWFDAATTGLPLNPHLTSSAFPPNNPVEGNATLTVDGSGNATVFVPITIQSKVMTLKSISGLDIVSSSFGDGGGLSSITVDLGRVTAADRVITRSCTASIAMGDLAMSISGLERDHTWPATFQVNFSGVPASGGGTLPAGALAALSGSEGVADEEAAEEAALEALGKDGATKKTGRADAAVESSDPEEGGMPLAAAGALAAVVIACAIAAAAVAAKRRKASESADAASGARR